MANVKHLQTSSSLVDFSPSCFKTTSCNLVFVVAVFTVMLLSTMRSEVHTSPRLNPGLFLCHQRICLKILITQQGSGVHRKKLAVYNVMGPDPNLHSNGPLPNPNSLRHHGAHCAPRTVVLSPQFWSVSVISVSLSHNQKPCCI